MNLKIEKNIPYPINKHKELVKDLISLEEGDSTYLKYKDFNKTLVINCIANARTLIASKGLCFKTIGDEDGRRIWVFKKRL